MRSIQYALIVVWQAVLLCVMLAVGSNITGIPLGGEPQPPGISELHDHLEP